MQKVCANFLRGKNRGLMLKMPSEAPAALFSGKDEARLSETVAESSVVGKIAKKRFRLLHKSLISLQKQQSAGDKEPLCPVTDGLVELQRIPVRHKERKRRLVFKDIAPHQKALALTDIGRIGDNDIEPTAVTVEIIRAAEDIVFHKFRTPGAAGSRILGRRQEVLSLGHFQSRRRYIDANDAGPRKLKRESPRDAAGARAQVQDTQRWDFRIRWEGLLSRRASSPARECKPCPFNDFPAQLFRFGARNQHVRCHIEAPAVELRPADDVLNRLPCRKTTGAAEEKLAVTLSDVLKRVGKDGVSLKMQNVLQKDVEQAVALAGVGVFG